MNCPLCGRAASTFLRYSFSLQGVSFRDSIEGKFTCRNCGILLQTTNPRQPIWIMTGLAVMFVAVYALLFRQIGALIGFGTATGLFLPLLLASGFGGLFIVWKNARVGKSEEQ